MAATKVVEEAVVTYVPGPPDGSTTTQEHYVYIKYVTSSMSHSKRQIVDADKAEM